MDEIRIGFLGFGEVGQRFASDLRAGRRAARRSRTFDLLLHQAAAGERMRRHAAAQRVELLADAAGLAAMATLIFSAVTADADAARRRSRCARVRSNDAWVVDLNSAAPATKIECAALVAAAGGRYVEAAVMTSVPPHGIRVPMLLGGAHAADAEKRAARVSGSSARRCPPSSASPRPSSCAAASSSRVWSRWWSRASPPRASRRGAAGARLAQGNLSAVRLGEAGRLPVLARDPARQAPRRGNARQRGDDRRSGIGGVMAAAAAAVARPAWPIGAPPAHSRTPTQLKPWRERAGSNGSR